MAYAFRKALDESGRACQAALQEEPMPIITEHVKLLFKKNQCLRDLESDSPAPPPQELASNSSSAGVQQKLQLMLLAADRERTSPGKQLKFGSCFADLLDRRTSNKAHYNPKHFDTASATKGTDFDILLTDDIAGGQTETILGEFARARGHDINVRRFEGDAAKSSFARKVGDDVFSQDRPGSVYLIPSRYGTAQEHHAKYVSYYKIKRARDKDPTIEHRSGRYGKRGSYKPRTAPQKPYVHWNSRK
jgi:hypothetical protein